MAATSYEGAGHFAQCIRLSKTQRTFTLSGQSVQFQALKAKWICKVLKKSNIRKKKTFAGGIKKSKKARIFWLKVSMNMETS